MKLEYKMEKGLVEVTMQNASVDLDKDGKPSVTAEIKVNVSVYELINEVAKKDIPFIESVLAQVKLGK